MSAFVKGETSFILDFTFPWSSVTGKPQAIDSDISIVNKMAAKAATFGKLDESSTRKNVRDVVNAVVLRPLKGIE